MKEISWAKVIYNYEYCFGSYKDMFKLYLKEIAGNKTDTQTKGFKHYLNQILFDNVKNNENMNFDIKLEKTAKRLIQKSDKG